MVVPVVWDAMSEGLRHPDLQLLEMAAVFRLGWWQTLRRVRIPSLLPYFTTACTTAMGLAWKSGVAAEVISRPALSIGGELQDAKVYLDTPVVFAWTITAVGLSLALERLLRAQATRWNRWYARTDESAAPEPTRTPGGRGDAGL
jgi:NitT/TauT family transport system permease protein